MVQVLNIKISDITATLFSVFLFFVRVSVHVYFEILSPVLLELVKLMLSVCLTMIRLLCC